MWSGFEPRLSHCVVFWDKILNTHSASLHPGESENCLVKSDEMMRWTGIESRDETQDC